MAKSHIPEDWPRVWAEYEPYTNMHKADCRVCGLVVCQETESEAQVAALIHVGRRHPDVYEASTGHYPTEERLAQQAYLLREGFG